MFFYAYMQIEQNKQTSINAMISIVIDQTDKND